MGLIILFLRFLSLIFWFFLMTFYCIGIYLFNITKGRWGLSRALAFGTVVWGRGIAYIIGLKLVKLYGDISTVKGLIFSNHQSYIDILVLSSLFKVRFTPKKEISNWPLLGWFIRLSKPIWIDRKSRLSAKKNMREFADTVNHGINLIIFPEGTTSSGKSPLLPFKSAVFEAAIKKNLILYPVLINYLGSAKEFVPWYGDMTLLAHAWKVLQLRSIEYELYILDPIKVEDGISRKELARKTYEIMNKRYLEVINSNYGEKSEEKSNER